MIQLTSSQFSRLDELADECEQNKVVALIGCSTYVMPVVRYPNGVEKAVTKNGKLLSVSLAKNITEGK